MFPKTRATGEYVYDDYPEYATESEYVYEVEPKAPYSRNKTNSDGDYVYNEMEGYYVQEKKSRTKDSNPAPGKPGHHRSEPNLYDELDYELSPRVEVGMQKREVNNDKTHLKDSNKKDGNSKKTKTIIVPVLGVSLVAAIFVILYLSGLFGSQGRYYFLCF